MRRNGILLLITFLPALTMLGSIILMNDDFDASRRGLVSICLLYFALSQMIIFGFLVGYLPRTNSAALRQGCLFFLCFGLMFALRLGEHYRNWFFAVSYDQNAMKWIILPLLAVIASVFFFIFGFIVSYRKRKKAVEDNYEDY